MVHYTLSQQNLTLVHSSLLSYLLLPHEPRNHEHVTPQPTVYETDIYDSVLLLLIILSFSFSYIF